MTQRADQKLSQEFKKDDNFESVLASLNECLSVEELKLFRDNGHVFPTLHILGAPRSGTTLVSQILLSYLPVGYINNLTAAFWKAPLYGIELSKKLLGTTYTSSFQSTYGRTDAIREPHEFGYFWNYHLRYDSLQQQDAAHEAVIDWQHFAKLMNNMTYRSGSPMLFKSFLFGFHAAKAVKYLPKTCFIYIKRNFLDNAFSILKLRKTLNGNEQEWGSIKPIQYDQLKSLSVYEQIAGQILCMEHEYLLQLDKIPEQNKAFFNYEDVCISPEAFLYEVNKVLCYHYPDFSRDSGKVKPFEVKTTVQDEDTINQFMTAKDKIRKLFPDLRQWNGNQ